MSKNTQFSKHSVLTGWNVHTPLSRAFNDKKYKRYKIDLYPALDKSVAKSLLRISMGLEFKFDESERRAYEKLNNLKPKAFFTQSLKKQYAEAFLQVIEQVWDFQHVIIPDAPVAERYFRKVCVDFAFKYYLAPTDKDNFEVTMKWVPHQQRQHANYFESSVSVNHSCVKLDVKREMPANEKIKKLQDQRIELLENAKILQFEKAVSIKQEMLRKGKPEEVIQSKDFQRQYNKVQRMKTDSKVVNYENILKQLNNLSTFQRGAAHEFGHMVGLRDEYPPSGKEVNFTHKYNEHHKIDRTSVMNKGELVRDRHYAIFADWLTTEYKHKYNPHIKTTFKINGKVDMLNARL